MVFIFVEYKLPTATKIKIDVDGIEHFMLEGGDKFLINEEKTSKT